MFGQGRSDHVNFIGAGVPTVFFSDATGPCYHTDSDDLAVVDYGKLDAQIAIVHRTMQTLAATNVPPTFTPTGTPLATYADALVLRDAINALQADLALFPPATATQLVGFRAELDTIADAGPAAFDATAIGRLLSISLATVGFFTQGPCDGFLAP